MQKPYHRGFLDSLESWEVIKFDLDGFSKLARNLVGIRSAHLLQEDSQNTRLYDKRKQAAILVAYEDNIVFYQKDHVRDL